ncbi:hypothetical protein T10_10190 [Trichinella papuae]|uniref:Uncharacterized protein n=1 Tax=Trichinella papuae TaxID=268474 RepID=A0A0V1N4B1_9BILA|nr:hypothetical protein T10_10190 [Trichinella papuae]
MTLLEPEEPRHRSLSKETNSISNACNSAFMFSKYARPLYSNSHLDDQKWSLMIKQRFTSEPDNLFNVNNTDSTYSKQ